MTYRLDKPSGNNLSMLGLGCMRFPRDKNETEALILAAINGGVNFFDTAYLYPNSEKTLGEILHKHDKRKDVYIATKLPLVLCKSPADFDKYFNEQLKRLRTDYVDYYFLHNITSFERWDAFDKMGVREWAKSKQDSGQIKQFGFSYHGNNIDFMKILDAHQWDFTMIQYNYYDENYQAGKKGLVAAAEKGVSVIIMEPLLGGKLASGLPKEAVKLFENEKPGATPADWALRWLWNHDEVTVVLSGMSSKEQVMQNIASAKNFAPLQENEAGVYTKVVEIFKKAFRIPCTGCDYCLPCPKGINIPACFSAYNAKYAQGFVTAMTMYLTTTAVIAKNPTAPHTCIKCGKCEKECPQNIPIMKDLMKVTFALEPLPLRLILKLVRKIMSAR